MAVAKASIENYYRVVLSGAKTRQRDQAMRYMLERWPQWTTRHEIARDLGIPIQSVCGAVNTLLRSEYIEQDPETSPDPITGNPAHLIRPAMPPVQQRSFDWFAAGEAGPRIPVGRQS